MEERKKILSVRDLEVVFSLRGDKLNAIRRCSLNLYEGETLAIVGESGSGKSVFTKCFVGMLDKNGTITGGSINYEGKELTQIKTEKEWLQIRGKRISMVMQDPLTALNPLRRVGIQIQEAIELHQGLKGEAAKKRPFICWRWSESPSQSYDTVSIHTNSLAVCVSESSLPLQ